MHIMDAMKVSMEQESNGEIVKSAVTDPAIKMKKNAGRDALESVLSRSGEEV